MNDRTEKPVSMLIPGRIMALLRERKQRLGVTHRRTLNEALDFAFRPDNRAKWEKK